MLGLASLCIIATAGPMHYCCLGRHVRFAMPPISSKPWLEETSGAVTGFAASMVKEQLELSAEMGFTYEWIFVNLTDEIFTDPNGLLHQLVESEHLNCFVNIMVGTEILD